MAELRGDLSAALADRYVIERELGRGGMATVFLAQDLRHERPVALKVLHPELAVALGAERFQREIKLAARLQHPHILTVHDSGEIPAPGHPPILWFTMPFIEGESLRDRLNREKQLRSTMRSGSLASRPMRSTTPTAMGSSTATSSRRTFSSARVTRWSPTSASARRSPMPATRS